MSGRAPKSRANGTDEAAQYAPDRTIVTVGGERFTIGPMTLRQSLRYRRLAPLALATPDDDDDEALERTSEGYVQLIALVLSKDADWVDRHCSAEEGMAVIATWAEHNEGYLGELVRLGQSMAKAVGQPLPMTPPGSA
jgi:hypothetical protein